MTLDVMEADLGTVASVVLDPDSGDIAERVNGFADLGGHLLILERVVCDKRFAGRQIGRWIAAEAIEAMSPGVELVAAIAAPMDGSTGPARAQSIARLQDMWSSVGFVKADVERSVMVLNPELPATHAHQLMRSPRSNMKALNTMVSRAFCNPYGDSSGDIGSIRTNLTTAVTASSLINQRIGRADRI